MVLRHFRLLLLLLPKGQGPGRALVPHVVLGVAEVVIVVVVGVLVDVADCVWVGQGGVGAGEGLLVSRGHI